MTTELKGKGNFSATPLEFDLDGKTYTYAGRGRWSVQLATVVVNGGKAPIKQKDGTWGWRDATAAETSAAEKLVNKIAAKLRAKAEVAAAKVAARSTKKATAPVAAEVTEAASD
jgi:hypothetical protein